MEILAVAIQKGGTGKTTTAAALAQIAAGRGKKVLAVDLDPQANLSLVLGADLNRPGCFGLLDGSDPEGLIQKTEAGVDVIVGGLDLVVFGTAPGSGRRLETALRPLRSVYDLIVVDTPPTIGELQYNALQAATRLLIPIQADIFGLQSFFQIYETAEQFQKSNPDLKIEGIVLTQHSDRNTVSRQMRELIEDQAGSVGVRVLGSIRPSVAVREAAALRRSLFLHAPKSKPAEDYLALYDAMVAGWKGY